MLFVLALQLMLFYAACMLVSSAASSAREYGSLEVSRSVCVSPGDPVRCGCNGYGGGHGVARRSPTRDCEVEFQRS